MSKWDHAEKAMAGDSNVRVSRAQQAEADHYDRDYSMQPSDARIQAQLSFMTEQLMISQKMFSELTNRLEPVLLPEFDEASTVPNDVPRKAASEISNVLDDLNGQITRLQGRISRVIDRVQL